MFEFLFRYPIQEYRQAEWFFASGWSLTSLLVLGVALAAAVVISVAVRRLSVFQKITVAALQVLSAAVLLIMLWQPSLRSQTVVPGDNTIAILLDTSRSMHYTESGETPIEQTVNALEQTQLIQALESEYKVSLHSVADQLKPLQLDKLPQGGSSSRLKSALTESLNTTSQSVLSGMILISDGADTSDVGADWWQQLSAQGVPVFAVGAGSEVQSSDVVLADISLRDSVTPDTRVNARVTVKHAQAGSTRLRITDGNVLVYSAQLDLPAGSTESSHALVFNSGEEGIKDLEFKLEPIEGERNLSNNSQRRILTVQDTRKRVLYIEGEPRWEYKFVRRALSDSAEIEIVSLLQTSPNKFYRQGVRNAQELEDGFPSEEQALFAYDAIIIGSIEAAKLSDQQQQHLRDFVRVRGGALLMLAGPHGLAEGGWSRTVVAQALPVLFNDSVQTYSRQRARAHLTSLGQETDWLRFAVDSDENQTLWAELPALADVQLAGSLKAGASALLETTVDDTRVPLLVSQRYGRGKSFVLATSGTWRWQMGLPAADLRHEQFWQGLLGELVAGTLEPLTVTTNRTTYFDENLVKVTIDARNARYHPDLSADLVVNLTGADSSSGSDEQSESLNNNRVKVTPTETPGRYEATLSVPDEGAFAVKVTRAGEAAEQPQVEWFLREDNRVEDFALGKDVTFLSKLASETGGQYLELQDLDKLPALLRQSQALLVKDEIRPLWNLVCVVCCCVTANSPWPKRMCLWWLGWVVIPATKNHSLLRSTPLRRALRPVACGPVVIPKS